MYSTLIIVGDLGKDPTMQYTPSGQAVTAFSVAVNHQYTGKDGQQVKETQWFRVEAWGKTAEICNQYLKKGSRVLVEGRLKSDKATGAPRIWNRQDGTPATSFEVTSSLVRFLDKAGARTGETHISAQPEAAPTDEEYPF